jgi:hypothetical protein
VDRTNFGPLHQQLRQFAAKEHFAVNEHVPRASGKEFFFEMEQGAKVQVVVEKLPLNKTVHIDCFNYQTTKCTEIMDRLTLALRPLMRRADLH